jgi:CheY-like chemotaxis protein
VAEAHRPVGAAPDTPLVADATTPGALSPARADWRSRHHDLRQPLNALGLFCAALRARPLGPAEQPLAQGIADAVAALEALIDAWAAEEARHEAANTSSAGAKVSPAPGWEAARAGPPDAAPPWASLPSAPAEREADADSASGEGHGQAQDADATPLIVVIDDDPGSRLSTAVLLEAWGARVMELSSIDELERWLDVGGTRVRPGLALVDFHLGASGTGLHALERLRAAFPQVEVPAVLISGDEAAAHAARNHPNLVTLRKPVSPEALLATVERRIRR